MRFARRTEWSLVPNALTKKLELLRRSGPVIDLTGSNPTCCGFSFYNTELLKPLADERNLNYHPDPKGLAETRQAIAAYYNDFGAAVDPSRIFLTSGTSEAYAHLFRLLCDAGDRVLVPSPGYPLFDYIAGLQDVEVARYSFLYDDGWKVDAADLQHALDGPVKALIAVHPNNPTGHFFSESDRMLLNRAARCAGAAVIADEVFLDFSFEEGKVPRSFAGNTEALTFTLGGLSKTAGLPQMKVAWVAVSGPDAEVAEACARLEVITDTVLSPSVPAQRAAVRWFERAPDFSGEIRARVRQNRLFLSEAVSRSHGVRLLRADAGWYAVLGVDSKLGDEELALLVLERARVFAHPGYLYDFKEGAHLVLSLLSEPDVFREGVTRLLATLAPAVL